MEPRTAGPSPGATTRATIPAMPRPTGQTRADPRSSRRLGSLLAAVALLAAACGWTGHTASPGVSGTSTPAPSAGASAAATPAAVYASIEAQVQAIRGLTAKTPVAPKLLDDAGIKKLTAD